MAKLSDIMENPEPVPNPKHNVIGGNFQCPDCGESNFEGICDMQKRIISWECVNGHKNEARL